MEKQYAESTPSATSGSKSWRGKEPLDVNVEDVVDEAQHNFSNSEVFDEKLTTEEEEIVNSHLNDITVEEALQVLRDAIVRHKDDILVPVGKKHHLERLVGGPGTLSEHVWEREVLFQAFLIKEWSIYPEVRAATVPIAEEEPWNPETFRVYFLGLIFSMCGSVLDTFFYNRFPVINISSLAMQIIPTSIGQAWGRMPVCSIPIGFGKRLTINPGPWSFKEQMLLQLLMSVSVGTPYAFMALMAQRNEFFYGFEGASFGYYAMLTFSTQLMGFGVSGLFRTFLVYPEQCVWFGVLPTITYCRAVSQIEPRETVNGWRFKRWEAFSLGALIMFCWYWVTNFLFGALSSFNWPAWIAPNNMKLQNMTGFVQGLGINPVPTFDWNVISQGGMVSPFWATNTNFIGMLISMIAILIVWFKNVRWTGYIPINSNSLYSNRGTPYQVRKVLNAQNLLDEEKYQAYSLPFYSAGNLVKYGAFFMIYPAMVMYALLNHFWQLKQSTVAFAKALVNPKRGLGSFDDRFTVAQRRHKEVPEWWFMLILLVSVGMAIATVEHYKFTQTPVWTIFFGIALCMVFMVPFGLLYAQANLSYDINVLMELIIGYAIPGNANANMISKCFATQFLAQTDNWITNQKQAHYTNIAPRALFRVQMLSVICNTWCQLGIMTWQLNGGIPDICDTKNKIKFTCQNPRVFFNAGVQWGTIGPRRVFGGLYPAMKYAFLVGACYPIPFWLFRKVIGPYIEAKYPAESFLNKARRFCRKWLNFHEIVLLSGAINWAPYNLSYYVANWYLAFSMNYVVRRRYFAWWKKYNYVLYAAFTVGTAWAGFIVFFSTEYHHLASVDWWGNSVTGSTGDASGGIPRLPIPDSGYFGPEPGSFP